MRSLGELRSLGICPLRAFAETDWRGVFRCGYLFAVLFWSCGVFSPAPGWVPCPLGAPWLMCGYFWGTCLCPGCGVVCLPPASRVWPVVCSGYLLGCVVQRLGVVVLVVAALAFAAVCSGFTVCAVLCVQRIGQGCAVWCACPCLPCPCLPCLPCLLCSTAVLSVVPACLPSHLQPYPCYSAAVLYP